MMRVKMKGLGGKTNSLDTVRERGYLPPGRVNAWCEDEDEEDKCAVKARGSASDAHGGFTKEPERAVTLTKTKHRSVSVLQCATLWHK